jgi:hypothetical protein
LFAIFILASAEATASIAYGIKIPNPKMINPNIVNMGSAIVINIAVTDRKIGPLQGIAIKVYVIPRKYSVK